MNWRIVPYRTEHTESLRLVYQQARQVAFPWIDPVSFRLTDFDEVIRGETVLVAVEQATPVGFIAWWPPDNFIHSLFVSPAYIGRGIGKVLLRTCLADIGRPVTLKCKAANQRALQFYYSQGWQFVEQAESPQGAYVLLTYGG